MNSNSDINLHISSSERDLWNKDIENFEAHKGAKGLIVHRLGNGVVPGFSEASYTPIEKNKLAGIQHGALNNPHPDSHPATMITGLANIAHDGRGTWSNLLNIPDRIKQVINGTADAATMSGGIRITIGTVAPSNPQAYRELWFDMTASSGETIKTYIGSKWETIGAVFQ